MASAEMMAQLQAVIRSTVADLQDELKAQLRATTESVAAVQRAVDATAARIDRLEQEKPARPELTACDNGVQEHTAAKPPAATGSLLTGECAKPPEFDGTGQWTLYKTQFEAASSLNGWDERRKATELVVALRGQAVNVLQSIPMAQLQDYNVLLDALETRYGERHLQAMYRTQLRTRTQQPAESLQQFAGDVESLGLLGYPDVPREVQDQIVVDVFIDGIRDENVRNIVCLGASTCLKDALACALRVDAVRSVRHGQSGAQFRQPTSCIDTSAAPCRPRGRNPPTCWTCGQEGHTKWNCPQKTD